MVAFVPDPPRRFLHEVPGANRVGAAPLADVRPSTIVEGPQRGSGHGGLRGSKSSRSRPKRWIAPPLAIGSCDRSRQVRGGQARDEAADHVPRRAVPRPDPGVYRPPRGPATARRRTTSWATPRPAWRPSRGGCAATSTGSGGWEQADDVCQNASLRLWSALKSAAPRDAGGVLPPGRFADPPRTDRPGEELLRAGRPRREPRLRRRGTRAPAATPPRPTTGPTAPISPTGSPPGPSSTAGSTPCPTGLARPST